MYNPLHWFKIYNLFAYKFIYKISFIYLYIFIYLYL